MKGISYGASKPSGLKVIASHPLVSAIIGVIGTIAGVLLTVLLSPDSNALIAANQRITVLEERLEKAQAEKEALIKAKQEVEEKLTAALTPRPFDSSTEQFTIPVGSFMGIMNNSYLAYVKAVNNGVADVALKNMEGADDQVYLSEGSQLVRKRRDFECMMKVLEVTKDAITMATSCRGLGN